MNNNILFVFLLLFCASFLSCEEKEIVPEDYIEPTEEDFLSLEVGDIFLYSYVRGEGYPTKSSEAIYTGDTLQLTVMEEIDGKFIIQEQITPNSAIFQMDGTYIYSDIEKKYELLWEVTEDSIIISKTGEDFDSHIFPYARSFFLAKETEVKAKFDGCRTTIPYEASGTAFYIENGKLNDIRYPHLNGIINYIAFINDGDGATFIYNKENGFVRVTATSGWTAKIRGWDRIK